MKHHAPAAHEDLCARDIYVRAMQPYLNQLAEADRERLLKQIPISGPPRRGPFSIILVALGNRLVTTGNWLLSAGKADASQDGFRFQNSENR